MMYRMLLVATVLGVPLATQAGRPAPPRVEANDNRAPAGRLRHDTLAIALEIRLGRWYPEADSGPSLLVPVFAEAGAAPRIPGPLIRVPVGAVIAATLTNRLGDSTVTVHGFYTRPGSGADSLVLAPGQRARVTFAAGAPGTYLYHAVAGTVDSLHEREQLAGAFIVDTAGAPGDDRIFVINIWSDGRLTPRERHALAINGRSFPFTELQTLPLGGPVDWRWINATRRNHPMHLHGFYFQVDSKGREGRDTVYAPEQAWQAVTEMMLAGSTMRIHWTPNRSGNWLFHCHVGFHVVPTARMEPPAAGSHQHFSGDMREHMAGLVLPITVPAGGPPTERGEARRLRLYVQAGPARGRVARALSYVPDRGAPPAPDSVEWPGGLLVLTRDEPTDIVVINRLPEATAVHWHGVELESYWDGVAGWSGADGVRAPVIAPGDSFIARLTLPRAGTFMYHTHLNDNLQLGSGLYGAIVVLEPGERFDPAHDHVYVAGWNGPSGRDMLVNGDSAGPPLRLRVGERHRLRFVSIGLANRPLFTLTRDSLPVRWRPLAKDGQDLPPSRAVPGPARVALAAGEIADMEFIPDQPGSYQLAAVWLGVPFFRQRIEVVP
ncbi:MAG: multicopper oxidase domain-containing protein [Gemmatimonadota bacterium]|nr:multicopper oxidase domain-containing protein [Gemmatimonadota bacterium]